MMIDFTCNKCDASFEIDAADLIEGNERVKCPNCDAKAAQTAVDDLGNALGEMCKTIAALRNRFAISLTLETDDLPAPYDAEEEEDEEDEGAVDEDENLLEEEPDEDDLR